MKWLQVALLWYVFGYTTFLTYANFQVQYWPEVYYLWDKGKDVLFLLAIINLIPKTFRACVRPVFILTIIRFIWEIISWITGIKINDSRVVGILFLALAVTVALLLIRDLEKCLKQKQ